MARDSRSSQRLCAGEAAISGFEEHYNLVGLKLVKTLSSPPGNAPKHFRRDCVLDPAADERSLPRASDALVSHWAARNDSKPSNRTMSTTRQRN